MRTSPNFQTQFSGRTIIVRRDLPAIFAGSTRSAGMYLLCCSDADLLSLLPKGGKWAEIGVFRGDFSKSILDICQPAELHLIDPWKFDLDFDWFAPPERSEKFGDARLFARQIAGWTGLPDGMHLNDHFQQLHDHVYQRFAGDPRVTIHRRTAAAAVSAFADGYFDFVYVDGAHDYENVLHDLTAYERKVNADGALLGDDYCEHGIHANAQYGVVGAVTHFRRTRGPFELLINFEPFSLFALFRPESRSWQQFLANLTESNYFLIELPDSIAANYHHRLLSGRSGRHRFIQSFA
jgi:hypothetical protein